jgi:aerobic carbon-monoxide dehydrogenase medium subunit
VIPFELVEPRTLHEAVALLDTAEPSVRPLAGGTAMMLMMKMGVLQPSRLVSLRAIEKRYSEIAIGSEGELRVGAMATLSALERSPVINGQAPVVTHALRTLSNIRVRNVATIGGHLAHADPHMDLPPVLIALGAHVSTMSRNGVRTFPLEALYAGYLETSLAQSELIAEVTIPQRNSTQAVYLKCTARSADDWPALGVAVALHADGDFVRSARLVIGGATDTPVRLAAAESALKDARADDKILRLAADAAANEAKVVSDQHGSAAYKRELIRVYVARAVRAALRSKTSHFTQ